MKKWQLGKKKMLGFLTAGAIVVTMAGSYAAWDQLSTDPVSQELSLRKPVTTAVVLGEFSDDNNEIDKVPVYESTVNYTVANVPTVPAEKELQVAFTTTVTNTSKENAIVSAEDVTVEIKKGTEPLTNNKDNKVVNGVNEYKIVVTPKETSTAKALAGDTLKVEVTSTLSEETKTP